MHADKFKHRYNTTRHQIIKLQHVSFIVVCFFFRVIIIRKRPTLLKLLYGLAVVIGLFVCLIPTIFPSVDPKAEKTKTETQGVSRVMWPIIFMLGFVSILCIQLIS